jgi:hypothetical protein
VGRCLADMWLRLCQSVHQRAKYDHVICLDKAHYLLFHKPRKGTAIQTFHLSFYMIISKKLDPVTKVLGSRYIRDEGKL